LTYDEVLGGGAWKKAVRWRDLTYEFVRALYNASTASLWLHNYSSEARSPSYWAGDVNNPRKKTHVEQETFARDFLLSTPNADGTLFKEDELIARYPFLRNDGLIPILYVLYEKPTVDIARPAEYVSSDPWPRCSRFPATVRIAVSTLQKDITSINVPLQLNNYQRSMNGAGSAHSQKGQIHFFPDRDAVSYRVVRAFDYYSSEPPGVPKRDALSFYWYSASNDVWFGRDGIEDTPGSVQNTTHGVPRLTFLIRADMPESQTVDGVARVSRLHSARNAFLLAMSCLLTVGFLLSSCLSYRLAKQIQFIVNVTGVILMNPFTLIIFGVVCVVPTRPEWMMCNVSSGIAMIGVGVAIIIWMMGGALES
jgi:hypothetical protein